ncbi:MAG: prepilin-type N-terminal cleavage/methylation domain-containing protein [Pseudomonadota bacterium]
MRRWRGARGFTLVETLVSLAIATIAVTGFYQALAQGAFMEQRADAQADQMFVAARIMDRVGVDIDLRPGTQENGALDGFEWRVAVTNSATEDMALGIVTPTELIFVYVTVAGGREDAPPLVLRAIRYIETPL